ncbi:hypothetical protein AKJ09_06157 [Labilithrix luteola]|uniref:Uncharacterized protein n=1 Tax=Labilithrix luteola TaxID=1391654 RepID=A0A0K1Q133_9BACT|nr:hypothetical protein [Labilithrix luteola]AKU99493.1 hypothetical protein AKJ09_06157 [Labilithrix luteola]
MLGPSEIARRPPWALLLVGSLACCTTNTTVTAAPPAATDGGGDPTGDAGGDESDTAPPACPVSGQASIPGTIDSPDVTETSGIVVSAVNEGVYWIHNDSGDVARAFAIGSDGKVLTTLSFDKTVPLDIEDVAIEDVAPGQSYLYFGDIGDNDAVRTSIKILRVEEPTLTSATTLTVTSEAMTVNYPNGPHNAETLLFDPLTKDLLIATKAEGGLSEIHRIGPFAAGTRVTTEKIAEVDVLLATGGEISRDGHFIAIRNYSNSAFVWPRGDQESIADALARPPCKLKVAAEAQGEAFAFLLENNGYVTISEGASPALHVTTFR